jgi:hypothetical protein
MTQEQGDALKALIDLAVQSNSDTSIVVGTTNSGKVLRVAVIAEGPDATRIVHMLRCARMLSKK